MERRVRPARPAARKADVGLSIRHRDERSGWSSGEQAAEHTQCECQKPVCDRLHQAAHRLGEVVVEAHRVRPAGARRGGGAREWFSGAPRI
jgi:hypothetical protein